MKIEFVNKHFKYYLLIIVIILSIDLSGQQLARSRRSSYYTFIYQIEDHEVKKLLKQNLYKFPEKLFEHKIDSFPTDSIYKRHLDIGHYLFLNVKGNQVITYLRSINNIEADILNNDRDFVLFVHNPGDIKPIKDAIVQLNNKNVPFDVETGTYVLEKSNKKGLLRIETQDETVFFQLDRDMYNSSLRRISRTIGYSFPLKYILFPFRRLCSSVRYGSPLFRSYNRPSKYKGYLALNKPKYLPGDTVKWKAFITKKNGKPFKKSVLVSFRKNFQPRNPHEGIMLNPTSKGAFNKEIVLGDSLKIDQPYSIEIRHPRSDKMIMQKSFYLEDYQLNESTYEIRSNKDEYHYKQDVSIYLSGKDANGFDLMDSRFNIKVRPGYVEDYLADEVFVADLLWEENSKLDPIGETKIVIPDSVFPNVNMDIKVEVVFNNSNNETHKEFLSFSYQGYNEWIETKLINDTIYATFFHNGESQNRSGWVYGDDYNNTLIDKSIDFPFKEKLNYLVEEYTFEKGNIYAITDVIDENSLFHCNTHRSLDSVFISFDNPRKIPIRYSILKEGNVVVEKGVSADLDWKHKTKNDKPYFIKCNYLWAGMPKDVSHSIKVYKKNLNVEIQHIDNIQPGQKVEVNVKVTDYKNKPVKDVDITAGAINSQFEDYRIPDVPYVGKYPKGINFINRFELSKKRYRRTKNLSTDWFEQFALDSIIYYRIIHPKGIEYLYDSGFTISNAQFAPFLFRNGVQQGIYMIYVDDKLIYYYDSDNKSPYSFIVEEGFHNVRLRTRNNEFSIDSVLFKKGMKLDMSIDMDAVPENIEETRLKARLSELENLEISSSMLQVKNVSWSNAAYVWQNDNVVRILPKRNHSSLLSFGPFNQDTINFATVGGFKTSFLFEPRYEYTIDSGIMKKDSAVYTNFAQSLYYLHSNKTLGQINTIKPLLFKANKLKFLQFLDDKNPTVTRNGNASYIYKYEGDSLFEIVRFSKYGTNSESRFCKSNETEFYELTPGMYQLLFYTENGNYLLKDSIIIRANGLNFNRINDRNLIVLDSVTEFSARTSVVSNANYSFSNVPNGYHVPNGGSIIKGLITDKDSGEPIPFASIILFEGDLQYAGTSSDFDGKYAILSLAEGIYNIKATFIGYKTVVIENIYIGDSNISFINIEMEASSEMLCEVEVVEYSIPLLSRDERASGATVTSYEIAKMPARSSSATATTVGGAFASSPDVLSDGFDNIPEQLGRHDLMDSRLSQKKTSKGIEGLRANFNDYAYWQPNLTTNEDGLVSFKVTFPDNITKWRSFALAMDSKRHSGAAIKEVLAYKQIIAQLATPRFLIVGDETEIIGKITNYTSEYKVLRSEFQLNKQLQNQNDTIVENVVIERCKITGPQTDSVNLVYMISEEGGYLDGEKRKIPVFPVGVKETKGSFYILESDTIIEIPILNTNAEIEVYANTDALAPLIKELDELEKYPYYCMEQSASKLLGLLMQKSIDSCLNKTFKKESKIKKMIRRLESGQNDDGSWGWWPNSKTNVWMTTYVLNSLQLASQKGYGITKMNKSVQYLVWHLDLLTNNELLYALNVLSEMKIKLQYSDFINELEESSLNLYQEFSLIRIKQNLNITYSLDLVLNSKKQTVLGNYYWGFDNYKWYNNTKNISLLAYQILENENKLHPYLNRIRNYFLEIKGQNKWSNTIEKAQIINTILPGMLMSYEDMNQSSQLKFGYDIENVITEFPFKTIFPKGEKSLMVEKTGFGPVYLTTYQTEWNIKPTTVDTLYKIVTWFERDNVRIDSLTAGEVVTLNVHIVAKKKGDYLMIEVPIPAGCSYDQNKNSSYYETHREYFKNRTTIFCENLPAGEYVFTINLQPRFSGVYTLNPAKVELMYFPVFYGRNQIRKTMINVNNH